MENVARWKRLIARQRDLITQVYTTEDIASAKREGKTGIILGWQNVSGIGTRSRFLPLSGARRRHHPMAYNTQNLVGDGCYEKHDRRALGIRPRGGGRDEPQRRPDDLSHVGREERGRDPGSKKPVAYSHCLPAGLKKHPRNKCDEQIRFIAERGGFVGVTMFPPFLASGRHRRRRLRRGHRATCMNLAGEDQVGIGTDFTQGYGREFFHWITHDKGYGRKLTDFGDVIDPEGISAADADFPEPHGGRWSGAAGARTALRDPGRQLAEVAGPARCQGCLACAYFHFARKKSMNSSGLRLSSRSLFSAVVTL